MDDRYNLQRFVDAQGGRLRSRAGRTARRPQAQPLDVFPQIAGVGHSEMARKYAISSLAEAKAYLEHLVLGPRLTRMPNVGAALWQDQGRVAAQQA
jgi:uncharacterized protein (DUF1810 family)